MKESINWLHISDLHFGCEGQKWLWPAIKHEFLRDVERRGKVLGGWDLVFFTGDIVNRGLETEFYNVTAELKEIWTVLEASGRSPRLCIVPGNHDLVRPSPDSSISKTFQQLWEKDASLRRQFWFDKNCEYRRAVNQFFENYSKWTEELKIPLIERIPGMLPGDFSATFTKGEAKLGIIGLNTTFLQIASGDYLSHLDVHVSQITDACGGDVHTWTNKHNACILLTHQPPGWLIASSLEHFRQEVYPSGRFIGHFYGHQHEPDAYQIGEGGQTPRRFRQAPSLFGLDEWQGVVPTKRIHGYNCGQYILESGGGVERIWPRIVLRGKDGVLRIVPDHTFSLQDDECYVSSFEINANRPHIQSDVGDKRKQYANIPSEAPSATELFSGTPNQSGADIALRSCPRLGIKIEPQHKHVRLDEQTQFEAGLREGRSVWVVADWGIGKAEFLSCAIERFRTPEGAPEVFHLRCDEATSTDDIEALFLQQFGMALQKFCFFASSHRAPFLLLDGIHPDLSGGPALMALGRLATAVLDYCPHLRIIYICGSRPSLDTCAIVELRPLDAPDSRTYVLNHPDASAYLHNAEIIERLHERSEGLPMHLDRMLRELKVSSLAAIVEGDIERNIPGELIEPTPRALIHAVKELEDSDDKNIKRSFRLLKVLSILQYGETLDSLHHYLTTEPFFAQNALYLNSNKLLDVIPIVDTAANVSAKTRGREENTPRVLKVSRPVRDYVRTLITEEERREIVYAGVDRFFGRGWRDGNVKIRTVPDEHRDYLNSGVGNEFVLIHHLLTMSRVDESDAAFSKACDLAIRYARRLDGAGRYRDLCAVTTTLLPVIDRDRFPAEWSRLSALCGNGLRMTTDREEDAILHHRAALDVGGGFFSDEEKASIWLEIALNQEWFRRSDQAIEAAERVQHLSKKDSASWIQAGMVLFSLKLKGAERTKALVDLEKTARSLGNVGAANNILMKLADDTDASSRKLKYYDRVLNSETSEYTAARAIVAKASATEESASSLNNEELLRLCAAYGYFHAQRFGFFLDSCHNSLWRAFKARGDQVQLLRLFRHTSFIWRIRGEESKERMYLEDLKSMGDLDAHKGTIIGEIRYFRKRLTVLLTVVVTANPTQEG